MLLYGICFHSELMHRLIDVTCSYVQDTWSLRLVNLILLNYVINLYSLTSLRMCLKVACHCNLCLLMAKLWKLELLLVHETKKADICQEEIVEPRYLF